MGTERIKIRKHSQEATEQNLVFLRNKDPYRVLEILYGVSIHQLYLHRDSEQEYQLVTMEARAMK